MLSTKRVGLNPKRNSKGVATAIAAIGQLFSAVAVALTLIYLTMQIRRAEIAASDANRLARANGVVTFWLEAMHDPEFREAGLLETLTLGRDRSVLLLDLVPERLDEVAHLCELRFDVGVAGRHGSGE